MWFIDSIFSLVWDIAGYFYDAYYEVSGWVWPFYYLANPLYWVYQGIWSLLTPIAQFGDWAYDVWSRVQNILSEWEILSLLRTWLNYAEWAWDWVCNAWYYVWNIVEDWWSSAQEIVKVWIQNVQDWALMLIYDVQSWLDRLSRDWDNFKSMITAIGEVIAWWGNWWGNILAFVNNWWNERLLDVQRLIDSTFKSRLPFYDDLALFFHSPLDWLLDHFADWFLGREE